MSVTRRSTVIMLVAVTFVPSVDVAVIAAVPCDIAFIFPFSSTVTAFSSELCHVTFGFEAFIGVGVAIS